MEDQLFFWIYCVVLILFGLIGLVQLVLVFRSLLIELQEGFTTSFARAITIFITSSLLFIIITWGFSVLLMSKQGGDGQREIPPDQAGKPEVQQLQIQLEKLNNEIIALQQQITTLQEGRAGKIAEAQEIEWKMGISRWPFFIPNLPEQMNNINFFLILALILVIVGTVSLFMFGDSQNLFPEDWLPSLWKKSEKQVAARRAAVEKLDYLAKVVQDEQYEKGLRLAEAIDQDKLNQLDRIDFLYLKSYCAVQLLRADWLVSKDLKKISLSGEKRQTLIQQVIEDLGTVLNKAPRMAEAEYLLAIALVRKGEYEKALELFKQAETRLSPKEINFKHMKSFCMLHIAEALLTEADNEGANRLFDEVISIGVMAEKIPGILVKNRLINVVETFNKGNLDEARKGLKTVQQVKDLTQENLRFIKVITEAMEILFLFTEKKTEETLRNIEIFLKKWSPQNLPEPDDQSADEYLFKVFDEKDLSMSPMIYRAFYFLEAVVIVQSKAASGEQLSKEETAKIATSLLKALQFEPRQRDVLAALGAFYFWFIPERRVKALEWMEAARSMGVESTYLHRLLEQYQEVEIGRKNILDRFMTLSARYLADASVNASIKEALVEELGQFQEFRPILLDLRDIGAFEEKSPTLKSLLNRSKYLQELTLDLSRNQIEQPSDRFRAINDQYMALVREIEMASSQLEKLEQQVMEEIARRVLN